MADAVQIPEKPAARPVMGVFWMLVTGACFVAVTAIVKVVGNEVPPAQSAFLRYVLGLVFLIPMIRPILRARLSTRALRLFGIRGVAHTAGVICWFYAMTQIPIAEVTAMNYLSPVYVTLLAVVFLGERLAVRRILAVAVALLGALIILRPGFRELGPGHFAMLFTAASFAIGYLIAKIMADEVEATVVVGMLSITVTICLAPFAWAVWVPVTWDQLGWLFLVAVFATGGHYTMTLAFAAAPLTVTQPVTFLQLVWATALGALVFSEPVDIWVIMGGGLIIAAISFMTWREAVLRRRAVTPSVPQTKI
ncbi:DMT family transporter [Rhodophyticola porphyridii]|uniref:DMT family transporter n=1 Tax=Rhodophyticola porphyridii TaxID=1852017 RepID=A0A3L9Y2H1_9RHOB|nr:DMT family transporter [Rhodophyticola porphyridii]RMA41635.1 DMT family transporter [Rhodophyticola porphyridii]